MSKEILKNQELGWHLDKRVPVGIIITMIAQTLAIVWYLATTIAELRGADTAQIQHVADLERNYSQKIRVLEETQTVQALSLARIDRIDERTINILEAMRRMEKTIDEKSRGR